MRIPRVWVFIYFISTFKSFRLGGSLRVDFLEEEGGAIGVGELSVGLDELGELVGGDEGGSDVGGSGEGEGVFGGVVVGGELDGAGLVGKL